MEMSTSYRYLAPATRIYSGVDVLENVDREAQRLGAERALVICSETLSKTSDLLERVKNVLGDRFINAYTGAKRESPIPLLDAGVLVARKVQPDLIVAVGGGSAVVTARAITIMLGENRSIDEMYTRHVHGEAPIVYRALKPKIPNVVVLTTPTTAVDRGGAAVWDENPPHRKEIYDPKTRPLGIILDGKALLTAPLSLYLDTSLTTFSGLIGAAQSSNLSPLAYTDVRQGVELSVKCLPQLVERPDDPHPRLHLATAALLANRASQSTYGRGSGRTTGMGRQLRYRYQQIGQGAAGCVMALIHLRLNRENDVEGQAQLAEMLGVRVPAMSFMEAAEAAEKHIVEVFQNFGAPTRLRDLGVLKEDFEVLAEAEVSEPAFGEDSNRVTDKQELLQMLREGW